MKKLTSIVLSLLLVLALVSVPGTKNVSAQEVEQTEEVVCDFNDRIAWVWGVLDVLNEEDAPSTIFFFWENDIFEEVPFFLYDPLQLIAYYRTTSHLDLVPEGWGSDEVTEDDLAQLFYECPEPTVTPTNTPTPTVEPTATATPTIVPTATLTPTIAPTATTAPTPTEEVTPTTEVTQAVTPTNEPTPTQEVTPTGESTPTPSTSSEPTATPTEEVTPTEGYEENEEENEEPTPTETENEEGTPTEAPTPETTTAPTSNPVGGAGDGLSDGRSDGLSDGKSSAPQDQYKGILGATTMAKTGIFEKALMNLSGIFGTLFVIAGSTLRFRKKNA